jgi:hypothetical protein
MSAQRRCLRCSIVYKGDAYSCPRCGGGPGRIGSCKHCGGPGCVECGRPPNPRIDGGCFSACASSCAGWIGAFVVALLLVPVIMWLAGGNPLQPLVDWLNSPKSP